MTPIIAIENEGMILFHSPDEKLPTFDDMLSYRLEIDLGIRKSR